MTQHNKEELRERLTPEQYRVTQENGTERAFTSELYHNEEDGIYVDVVDGTPLSLHMINLNQVLVGQVLQSLLKMIWL